MEISNANKKKFQKWKDFYENTLKRFDVFYENTLQIFNNKQFKDKFMNFPSLQSEFNEDLENDIIYDESYLKKLLKAIEDLNNTSDRNPGMKEYTDKLDKIFETQYNTLRSLHSMKTSINTKINKKNTNIPKYKRYLDYIRDLIYLKLYKDLFIIIILSNTFLKTDNVINTINRENTSNPKKNTPLKNIRELPKGANGVKNAISPQNLSVKPGKPLKQNINKSSLSNIPKSQLNKKQPINPKITQKIIECNQKLEKSLKDFVKKLNSLNTKKNGGGNVLNSNEFIELSNNSSIKEYQAKLKKIKKAYEDGLQQNIDGFKKICKLIQDYISKLNKIVSDFISSLDDNNNIRNNSDAKLKELGDKLKQINLEINKIESELKVKIERFRELENSLKNKEDNSKNINDISNKLFEYEQKKQRILGNIEQLNNDYNILNVKRNKLKDNTKNFEVRYNNLSRKERNPNFKLNNLKTEEEYLKVEEKDLKAKENDLTVEEKNLNAKKVRLNEELELISQSIMNLKSNNDNYNDNKSSHKEINEMKDNTLYEIQLLKLKLEDKKNERKDLLKQIKNFSNN